MKPGSITIRVQSEPFDLGAEVNAMSHTRTDIGAIASFVGLARDSNDGSGVQAMTLEHYPGMTEKALVALVDEACARWTLLDVTVIHRVGRLLPGDPIVLVAVASSHRGEAFAACEFIMDALKTRAPFWKKEETPAGERWVDARASDDAAARVLIEEVRRIVFVAGVLLILVSLGGFALERTSRASQYAIFSYAAGTILGFVLSLLSRHVQGPPEQIAKVRPPGIS